MAMESIKRANPGEGDLFFFHGAFNDRKAAIKKSEDTPGSFLKPVYFRGGMRYAVLTPKRAENPNRLPVVRWRKPGSELSQPVSSYRSNHPSLRPKAPKKCALCGSRRHVVVDHKNGVNSDIRRGNLRWLCASCNTKKGFRDKKAGRGVRIERGPFKDNPKIGSLVMTKLTSTRPRKKGVPKKRVLTIANVGERKTTRRNPKLTKPVLKMMVEANIRRGMTPQKAIEATAKEVKEILLKGGLYEELRAKGAAKNPISAAAAKAEVSRFIKSVAAGYGAAKAAMKKSAKPAKEARKNPLHASRKARATSEMFHGRAPRRTTLMATQAKLTGKNFAKIGDLVSLTVGNRKVSFESDKTQPIVVTDARAKKLFFLGGNQDLRALRPVRKANPGGLHDMGEVSQIEYFARKKFDQFRPTVYFHNLGEENGKKPRLMYDPVAEQMYLVGGDYQIEDVGIVN